MRWRCSSGGEGFPDRVDTVDLLMSTANHPSQLFFILHFYVWGFLRSLTFHFPPLTFVRLSFLPDSLVCVVSFLLLPV